MTKLLYKEVVYHLLTDDKPSEYLNSIKNDLKNTPFQMLYDLLSVEQELEYHPEGVVWNHVMMVVDMAAKIRKHANDKECFMVSAMLHDIGKVSTTKRNKKGRWTSYNHDTVGSEKAREILKLFDVEEDKIEYTCNLINFHMHHLYIIKNLHFGNVEKMISKVYLKDMILLFICDRLGRGESKLEKNINEMKDIKKIVEILKIHYNIEVFEFEKLIDEIINNMKNGLTI